MFTKGVVPHSNVHVTQWSLAAYSNTIKYM